MNRSRAFSAVVLVLVLGSGAASTERSGDPAHGKILYQRYCVSCHGAGGDGGGDGATWLTPKPRDYRQGTFKLRSTPTGSLPQLSDLERTLVNGIYGTAMPSWRSIGHRSRQDVIAYIQTFSERWRTEKPDPPVPIPPEPVAGPESVHRGREIYLKNGCADCHGDTGRGDGPSGRSLRDDWGNPLAPADLTQSHHKCGDTATDVYRILMTGMNGTPMPSFADSINAEEGWDLVHYVQSLGPARNTGVLPDRSQRAARSR